MLATIQSLINVAVKSHSESTADKSIGWQLAAAALMLEVSVADFDTHPDERAAVSKALRSSFALSEDELDELAECRLLSLLDDPSPVLLDEELLDELLVCPNSSKMVKRSPPAV